MKTQYIIDKRGSRRLSIKLKCNHCGKEFWAEKRFYDKGGGKYCSHKCSSNSKKNRISLICAICKKSFERSPSHINGKNGIYFCSRKCKDLSQKIHGGIKEVWPSHYNNGSSNYRDLAFNEYEHKCANPDCGWNEDTRILHVHHIDGNRKNNDIKNLVILCPNCHWKITLSFYKLSPNNTLIEL